MITTLAREGGIVTIGPTVESPGLVVSDRDVFLPLYRLEIQLTARADLMTTTVQPAPDGSLQAPPTTVDLAFPDGLQAAYLARLAAADLRVRWDDTATERADLVAALAWDGAIWVQGATGSPGLLPGAREASFTGGLPVEGRPSDLAATHLQAAAVPHSAVVGHVPVSFEVTLRMGGQEPPGLPPSCGHVVVCLKFPAAPRPAQA